MYKNEIVEQRQTKRGYVGFVKKGDRGPKEIKNRTKLALKKNV